MNLIKSLFDLPLAKHDIRRYRAALILFAIVTFLLGPFLLIFLCSIRGIESEIPVHISEREFNEIAFFVKAYVAGFAMLAGAVGAVFVCNRYTSRDRTYFYNSLPVKRHTAFITDNLCMTGIFAATLTVNILISYFVALFNFGYGLEFLKIGLSGLGYGLAYFIIIYSVFTLCGQLCSSTGAQIILGGSVCFYLPLLLLMLTTTLSTYDPTYNANYYSQYASWLSPVTSYFANGIATGGARGIGSLELTVWLVLSAVALVVSCKMFAMRKSEDAGNALSFVWVRYPVRVMFISLIGLGSGTIFYTISGDSMFWAAVGIIIGSLLTHMVINGIIFKSVAKLLYGVLSFVFITAALLIVTVALRYNLFGISNIPEKDAVRSIEIRGLMFDEGIYFETDNKELVDTIYDLVDDSVIMPGDNNVNGNSYGNYYYTNTEVVYKTALGTKAKKFRCEIPTDKLDYYAEKICSTEEYRKYGLGYIESMISFVEGGCDIESVGISNIQYQMGYVNNFTSWDNREFLNRLAADFRENEYSESYVLTVDVQLYTNDGRYRYYNVAIPKSYKKTLDYVRGCGYNFDREYVLSNLSSITVYGRTVELDGDIAERLYDHCTEFSYWRDDTVDVYFKLSDKSAISLCGENSDPVIKEALEGALYQEENDKYYHSGDYYYGE